MQDYQNAELSEAPYPSIEGTGSSQSFSNRRTRNWASGGSDVCNCSYSICNHTFTNDIILAWFFLLTFLIASIALKIHYSFDYKLFLSFCILSSLYSAFINPLNVIWLLQRNSSQAGPLIVFILGGVTSAEARIFSLLKSENAGIPNIYLRLSLFLFFNSFLTYSKHIMLFYLIIIVLFSVGTEFLTPYTFLERLEH